MLAKEKQTLRKSVQDIISSVYNKLKGEGVESTEALLQAIEVTTFELSSALLGAYNVCAKDLNPKQQIDLARQLISTPTFFPVPAEEPKEKAM